MLIEVRNLRILITGGAGFIGSHLCDHYVKKKATVLCLDNFLNGDLLNIRHLLGHRNFKLIKGDVTDYDIIEKNARDVDVIFHLAAQIHVDRSIVEPRFTYDVNVKGTQNILEAARILDVDKTIFASSSEVYGTAEYVPMDENHPLNSPHPYGASKIAADRMCSAYMATYGMNVVIMRSFNTYGPRQKDTGYGGAISIFIKRAMNNIPPIIYGDGNQTRDYTYIEDIVDAYDLVLRTKSNIKSPINFGTGSEIRIIDLANKILEKCECNVAPVHIEPRPGEVMRMVADSSLAREMGWKPRYSIDQGLTKLIEWYKHYGAERWIKMG